MKETLEHHLRDLYAFDAESFDTTGAEERLQAVTYKPRIARRNRVWAAIGTSATAIAATIVALVSVLSAGAPVAYAGWTPQPKVLTSAQLTQVRHTVRHDWAPHCSGSGGTIVLADVRGPYTFSLYVTNPQAGALATICLNGVEHGSGGFSNRRTGHKHKHVWPPPIAAGNTHGFITVDAAIDTHAPSQLAFTEVGRAGSDVRAISAVLSTGKKVQATISHGWYLVWWPAKRGDPKKLLVTTTGKAYETEDPSAMK